MPARVVLVLFGLIVGFCPLMASGQVYDLVAGDAAVIFHYPGADGLIGTADDPVSAEVTGIVGSDPNVWGTYSYAAFEAFVADPWLPADSTAVSFVHGSLELDPAVAAGGAGPLVVGGIAVGTGFGQGLGLSSLEILAVNGGTFDTGTGAVTLDVDIEASAAGITRQVTGGQLTGTAIIVDSADFGAFTGDPYVENVLIPRAQALGADGLVFMELEGQAPLDPPWVIIPAQFSVVLAGFTGISAAQTADLAVAKFAPTGPFVADDTLSVDLEVTNNGPGDANGVVVHDRIPDGMSWLSDTCAAGPPAGDILTWDVGSLNDGQSEICEVTLQATADANFDQVNAAVIASAQFDPDPANNVAEAIVGAVQPGVPEGLDQPPDGITGFPSDAACGSCPLGAQIMAENFKVEDQFQLREIVFFGGYTDNLPIADQFTIEIRDNLEVSTRPGVAGVPGGLVAVVPGAVTRTATGNQVAGFFDEFRYAVNTSIDLNRGIYWLLIHNDSTGSNGDWFWESGSADALLRSVATITSNQTVPPHPRWSPSPDFELALFLSSAREESPPSAVPVAGVPGLALLAAVLLVTGLWALGWFVSGAGYRARFALRRARR